MYTLCILYYVCIKMAIIMANVFFFYIVYIDINAMDLCIWSIYLYIYYIILCRSCSIHTGKHHIIEIYVCIIRKNNIKYLYIYISQILI